jgi:LysR family glycine cleavage system transcriptional activator
MSSPLARLASLDNVRGFVAVGRRMSITLAAQDLFLTQSAVSRQIQGLEEALGTKLFARGHRSLTFTPDGERLFRIADPVLQQLQDAFGSMGGAGERLPVTVTASVGVSGLWLLPRLGRFQQEQPEIDVRVAASNKLLDLRVEGVDLAIRYCRDSSAPPAAVRLFGESVLAVASPSLGARRLDLPSTIAGNVLLEFDDPGRPWLQWSERLSAIGMGAVKPKGILRFNQYDQLIQGAIAGQGIALGRVALVENMLADGRLVALQGDLGRAASDYGYWLIKGEETARDEVQRVTEWILREAKATEALLALGQSKLMRFPTAIKRDPAIEVWMREHPGALGAIARHWFDAMRRCGDDVQELLHDGHPTACVGDAAFGYVNVFKAHVNVGFFRGAELADPKSLLEGTGRFMRHVKLTAERAVDATALATLIETAYADIKKRISP